MPRRSRPPSIFSLGKHQIKDLKHYQQWISDWALELKVGDIILMDGPVGAGKTQGVRFLVESLGGRWVSSPSFAIHQRYAVVQGYVDHVDLYRLESEEDLESTGFWDLIDLKDSILIIEWPSKIQGEFWPPWRRVWHLTLEFSKASSEARLLHVEKVSHT